jgi:hypothetical protein
VLPGGAAHAAGAHRAKIKIAAEGQRLVQHRTALLNVSNLFHGSHFIGL